MTGTELAAGGEIPLLASLWTLYNDHGMHLNTNPEHWNYHYYFAFLFYENTSFLRTAQMGVHHMVLLRTDCYTVTLQDSCLGVHLLHRALVHGNRKNQY